MKASLALFSLLTVFTSYSLKSPAVPPTVVQIQANTNLAIADGARQQIGSTLFYDPAYVQLTYPGGDVPQERGVCSDVVIRALRSQRSICRNWCTKIWRRILLRTRKMAVKAPGQQHRSPSGA